MISPLVGSCGSGVTAAVLALALEHAGRELAEIQPRSSRDPAKTHPRPFRGPAEIARGRFENGAPRTERGHLRLPEIARDCPRLPENRRASLLEIYDGSWAEYGGDESQPLATGPAPPA